MAWNYDTTRCGRCSRGLPDEDIAAGHRRCLDCRLAAVMRKAAGECACCGGPIGEEKGFYCPDCKQRDRENHAKLRRARGGLSQVWRRKSVRCPVCGEKALTDFHPRLQCGRCGYSFQIVDKNTVVAPTGRLTHEQQREAKRCPACGKKRLLAASARRYECNGCGQCFLRSEEPNPEYVRPAQERR